MKSEYFYHGDYTLDRCESSAIPKVQMSSVKSDRMSVRGYIRSMSPNLEIIISDLIIASLPGFKAERKGDNDNTIGVVDLVLSSVLLSVGVVCIAIA
jgi:hypothetical protein